MGDRGKSWAELYAECGELWSALYDELASRLLAHVAKHVGCDRGERSEIAQHVWAHMPHAMMMYKPIPDRPFAAYFWVVVKNEVRNWLRAQKRAARISEVLLDSKHQEPVGFGLDDLERKDFVDHLRRRVIEKHGAEGLKIMWRKYCDGLSWRLAKDTDTQSVPFAAVWKRLLRRYEKNSIQPRPVHSEKNYG